MEPLMEIMGKNFSAYQIFLNYLDGGNKDVNI